MNCSGPRFSGYQVRFQEEKLRPQYPEQTIAEWKKQIGEVIADNQEILNTAPFSSDQRDVVFLFGPDSRPTQTDLDGLLENTRWVSYSRDKAGSFGYSVNRLGGKKLSTFRKLDWALADLVRWPAKKTLKDLFQLGKASYDTASNRLNRMFRKVLLFDYALHKHGPLFPDTQATPEQVQKTLASRAETEEHFGIQPEWFKTP